MHPMLQHSIDEEGGAIKGTEDGNGRPGTGDRGPKRDVGRGVRDEGG